MKAKLIIKLTVPPAKALLAVKKISEADFCSFWDDGICFCRRHRIGGGTLFINGVNEFDGPAYKVGSGAVVEYWTGSGKGAYTLCLEPRKKSATLLFEGRRNSFLRGSEVFLVDNGAVYIGSFKVGDIISGVVVTTTPERRLDNLPAHVDFIRH